MNSILLSIWESKTRPKKKKKYWIALFKKERSISSDLGMLCVCERNRLYWVPSVHTYHVPCLTVWFDHQRETSLTPLRFKLLHRYTEWDCTHTSQSPAVLLNEHIFCLHAGIYIIATAFMASLLYQAKEKKNQGVFWNVLVVGRCKFLQLTETLT